MSAPMRAIRLSVWVGGGWSSVCVCVCVCVCLCVWWWWGVVVSMRACMCVGACIETCDIVVGRTYQTETAMWGDTFYSATITLFPPVTLILHGLLPLHPLPSIHVLLHNVRHPLSF